jgi:hypothetical protein
MNPNKKVGGIHFPRLFTLQNHFDGDLNPLRQQKLSSPSKCPGSAKVFLDQAAQKYYNTKKTKENPYVFHQNTADYRYAGGIQRRR